MGVACAKDADWRAETISCDRTSFAQSNKGTAGPVKDTSVALVDDEEILFIGRRAARDEVDVSDCNVYQEMDDVSWKRQECTGGNGKMASHSNNVEEDIARWIADRRDAKEALSRLVRSLVRGRSLTVCSAAGGTLFCTAYMDRALTTLRLCRRTSSDVLRIIRLETVAEVLVDCAPGAARYTFGKSRVKMRLLGPKQEVLFVSLGSREECNAFASCIGACAKQQRLASQTGPPGDSDPRHTGAYADAPEHSLLSVPSTLLRAVAQLAGVDAETASSTSGSGLSDLFIVPKSVETC